MRYFSVGFSDAKLDFASFGYSGYYKESMA